jgi:L-iditol 2-dehydrogenase
MRAGRLVAAGTMSCEDDVPVKAAADGQLLVRSTFASICGSDLHTVYPSQPAGRSYPAPPGFPGHEGVGVVDRSLAPGFRPGDRVLTVPNYYAGMCFAEVQTIPAAYCIKLPDTGVADECLLMAQQLGTVIFALKRKPIDVRGKTVAILGQGSAGAFFAMLARRMGAARIVVTDLSPERLAYSETLGVDAAIDGASPDASARVREECGGVGAQFVVEAVGTGPTLACSVEVAAPGADLLWFGLPDGPAPVPFPFQQFFGKRLAAWSVFGAQDEAGHASFKEALQLISSGAFDVRPLLSHVLPISEIGKAFELAHERTDGALKVSISF